MTATGHLYIAAGDSGLTTFTVSLARPDAGTMAVLKAALTQRGFPSVMFRGASVVFVVDSAKVHPSVGLAIDAIGSALGGIAYRFTLSGYQVDKGTKSERLAFEVAGGPGMRAVPMDTGSPCPRCGETEHVVCTGNLYVANDSDSDCD